MSTHVSGSNISTSWLAALAALNDAAGSSAVNFSVTVEHPDQEIANVRQALDRKVAELHAERPKDFNKSVHTVANTIFPISLYRVGKPENFYSAALIGQSGRSGSITSWGPKAGTYIGRLLRYPTYDGTEVNQLRRLLEYLDSDTNWADRYEVEMSLPSPDMLTSTGSASTYLAGFDNAARGGQCMSHLSLNLSGGKLSMVALYRHQTYISRAYGNLLGLARLLKFLAAESKKDLEVGELMVVASHAEIEQGARRSIASLLDPATNGSTGAASAIEWHSRPFGSTWSDLELPRIA